MVITPKDENYEKIRLCLDMRTANTAIQRVRYPIPTLEEALLNMNNAKRISKVDVKEAFHQLELEFESRELTTFYTPCGLYRYKRLNYGTNCASEIFQSVINGLLADIPGVRCIADDIVVFGGTNEEHNVRLELDLQKLADSELTLNKSKCEFGLSSAKFMGHVLSEYGVTLSEGKVRAIVDTRTPTNMSELRSFLGLANYMSRYIRNFATISSPLWHLIKKSAV